jgi:hypothetical protein
MSIFKLFREIRPNPSPFAPERKEPSSAHGGRGGESSPGPARGWQRKSMNLAEGAPAGENVPPARPDSPPRKEIILDQR